MTQLKRSAATQLNWLTKRKLYRLSHYLLQEFDGVQARPLERYRLRTHTNSSFLDWAIDFRSCGACDALDAFYLQPGDAYHPVPKQLKPLDRSFWRNVRQKTVLVDEGQRILRCF